MISSYFFDCCHLEVGKQFKKINNYLQATQIYLGFPTCN